MNHKVLPKLVESVSSSAQNGDIQEQIIGNSEIHLDIFKIILFTPVVVMKTCIKFKKNGKQKFFH